MPSTPSQATIVNKFGKMTGWNSISAHMLGRDVEAFTAISYDDNVDVEGVKGGGKFDIGYGVGNYEAKVSITLLVEEMRALLDAMPPNSYLWDIPPFPIVVEYEYHNKIYKDVIADCIIKNNGIDVKQGDKSIATKYEIYTPQIKWN